MSLKDDLLPLVDTLRGIPADLGFRPYQVWARKTEYAGPRVGLGAFTVTETRLLVGGRDPKVRTVTSKDVVAGTPEMQMVEYEIGPLTPDFGSGGVAESTVNPEASSTPATIMFVLKGPGLPSEGLLCQRISERVDHPLQMTIRVRGSGRKRPS
jgi:hypothetical protein